MTSEQIRLRSELLGTQIITRDSGKRLGVVSQLWVDVDRWQVVAFGVRENILSGVVSGIQETMMLDNIRQIGDVMLVEDDAEFADNFNPEAYSSLIGSEVITENGEMLGRVRGFKFDPDDGALLSIVIASVGLPFIPEQVVSTYELSIDEVVSVGPDRLIVFEGSEQKLVQISVGLLERVGIGRPPWERDLEDEYIMPTAVSNQLGTGVRTSAEPSRARETWDDDTWEEPQPMRRPIREPLRQPEPEYEYEEENWQEAPPARYERRMPEPTPEPVYDDTLDENVWEDDENPQPYRAPQVNIPERRKVVEYEEEADYSDY
ncbi:PRC-barrel domain-containing protein [Vacuolonema iberomarrocanum]|uniref:PRC-barrel domain-containing protein n=1 Tax=Vacuolonema iberomarrocanum TaxID=3454632 RepID=UPI001A0042E8|nr:PRC-barrel domain-containing protein [filamentous cyanobacterium LEGE 07170]